MTTAGPTIFERNRFTRRRFMQYSAATTGVIAASPYLSKLQAFAAPPVADDQGILVTINLAGGNDGLNMVIPYADPRYGQIRSSLRITNSLPIGGGVGLHPSMPKLKARYDQGKVAVVRGVGYRPPDLSHFTSGDIWMHGWGGRTAVTSGWAGRFLDQLPNAAHESLYGVSLHGNVSEHLQGNVAHPSSLPLHIGGAFGIDRRDASDARMFDAIASLGVGASGRGALGDLYDQTESDLMALTQRIRPAYGFADQPNDLQQQLVLAAHLINANLGIRVIDTELDGFDTHSDQHDWHGTLLARLDNAIAAFFTVLEPKWGSHVALMTFSEFGRRPEENGDHGTDHGTAAPHFVIGDHVKGGLHGAQPSLTDLDRDGNLVPLIDFHQMYASILSTWLAADDRALLGKSLRRAHLVQVRPRRTGRLDQARRDRGLLARRTDGARARLRDRDQVRVSQRARAPPRHGRVDANAQRVVARRLRRRHLLVRRRRLPRLHRRGPSQQADRRHGRDANRQGLLALRQRRRHLRLRRRRLPRLHRRDPSQQADRRHGREPDGERLLALRQRRRHLRLRRRRLPRLHRRDPSQQANRRHGRDTEPARATGSAPATAASSTTATPASTARRCPRVLRCAASHARGVATVTGWRPPTAPSPPSATRPSSATRATSHRCSSPRSARVSYARVS